MYVGKDFDPIDAGSSERFTFDFANDLQPGDAIGSASWQCEVAAISEGTDPDAASHIDGPAAVFRVSMSTQRISGLQPGVTYCLTATAQTLAGDVISLWSHVRCRAPE